MHENHTSDVGKHDKHYLATNIGHSGFLGVVETASRLLTAPSYRDHYIKVSSVVTMLCRIRSPSLSTLRQKCSESRKRLSISSEDFLSYRQNLMKARSLDVQITIFLNINVLTIHAIETCSRKHSKLK